jgi:hypothetical protein
MAAVNALGADDLSDVAWAVTIGLVLIGVLLFFIITSVVGRCMIAIVVLALAATTWAVRHHVTDQFSKCHEHPTFFGIHVDKPSSWAGDCGI